MKWLAIAIICISAPARAEVGGEQKLKMPETITPPWELYDADEDGYITVKEAAVQKMSPQVFRSLDIDYTLSLHDALPIYRKSVV